MYTEDLTKHKDKHCLKTGSFIKAMGMNLLVLGYSDYKRTILVVADRHGNKYYI